METENKSPENKVATSEEVLAAGKQIVAEVIQSAPFDPTVSEVLSRSVNIMRQRSTVSLPLTDCLAVWIDPCVTAAGVGRERFIDHLLQPVCQRNGWTLDTQDKRAVRNSFIRRKP